MHHVFSIFWCLQKELPVQHIFVYVCYLCALHLKIIGNPVFMDKLLAICNAAALESGTTISPGYLVSGYPG